MTATEQRLPLAAQFVEHAQNVVPREVCANPGSRDFRLALDEFARTLPVYLMPSRRETRQAIACLRDRGRLAPWMGQP
ncbi:hypothetical protein [Pseudolysinimonas sp.]|jgi:hypothetical protein|uniref:hypothetical protein n=1 Tax=Pseudolysinimonas sp. TaxID=2680009 RepID=UPI00378457FC